MRVTEAVHGESDVVLTRRRLMRNTYLVLAAALVGSLAMRDAGVIFGVALGGALGLLNIHWLSASLGALLSDAARSGQAPPWAVSKFILRYLVIGSAIGLALWSGRVNLLALVVGFCAFVGAATIEAGYQIYRLLAHREDATK
ncbi:MAG: hypothetical protein D6723_09575 [Acidobacteria bacterium]|nr:MAG: hypothetical protein D6723_09575 [Acidobacteriota bacterium]